MNWFNDALHNGVKDVKTATDCISTANDFGISGEIHHFIVLVHLFRFLRLSWGGGGVILVVSVRIGGSVDWGSTIDFFGQIGNIQW